MTKKLVALVLASALVPAIGLAQDAADARATEFRAMTGPAQESVPGGVLVIAAYAAIWLFVFAYVLHLSRVQAGTRAELGELTHKLDALDKKISGNNPS